MITIITGQPGNGKTLLALFEVEKQARAESRPVFVSDIPELTLPWEQIGDLKKRITAYQEDGETRYKFDFPAGSIVLVDEAQRWYRARTQGAQVPPHVQALETHRHAGIDFFFVTQHPQLIDTAVRKLAGRHVHVVRRFGRPTATRYQWEECKDPSSEVEKKKALTTTWAYPKQVFDWYKSAEQHTVKRDFPLRKWLQFAGLACLVVALLTYAFHFYVGGGVSKNLVAKRDARIPSGTFVDGPSSSRPIPVPSVWDPLQSKPRVKGLQMSAPMYDGLQRVVSMPKLEGCVSLVDESGVVIYCSCSAPGGYRLKVETQQCLEYSKDGWFDYTASPPPKAEARSLSSEHHPTGDDSG